MQEQSSSIEEGKDEELAYVILEDCEVSLVVSSKSSSSFPIGKWIDVDLRNNSMISSSSGDDSPAMSNCEQCDLVLHADAATGRLHLFLDRVAVFNGDVLAKSICTCGKRSRSDSSLFVGMLKRCDPEIVTKTCKVFMRNDTRRRAALVFTLCFPSLMKRQPGARSMFPDGEDKRNKILVPEVQAVLSICRSDWDLYDLLVGSMESMFDLNRLPKEPSPTFIPTKMTLEEMYSRVNGSPVVQHIQHNRPYLSNRTMQPDNAHLAKLPKDILTEHLAPFLTSRPLDALRCTCSYLHKALEAVVPGLKLRLYKHQIKSLSWMRTREARSLLETDLIHLPSSSPHAIDGDAHRSATCGLTTKLVPRSSLVNDASSNAIRINQLTGREVEPSSIGTVTRNVARGGLLCDDPGLGKTITVLSLLLQTTGMTPSVAPDTADCTDSEARLFQAYWGENYVVDWLRKEALLKLFNSFVRSQNIINRILVGTVRKAIETDVYGADFEAFERHVEKSIQESLKDNEEASREHVQAFRGVVAEFRKAQCQRARKSFSNSSAKPNSHVADLIEQDSRAKLLGSLLSSKASLLVVPAVLVDHWEEQIKMHIDFKYLTSKKPLVYNFDGSLENVSAAWKLIRDEQSHAPILFLDRGGAKPLPPPEFLAQFQIVITSNQRFVNEWKNGSFQEEIRREDLGDDAPDYLYASSSSTSTRSRGVCPLLKIYWHRLVVDEGHSMAKDTIASGILFASWLPSERRWAMTGTPTKQGAQLGQVKGLVRFLRHDFFTKRCEGDAFWKKAVVRYWKLGSVVSFFRLRSLLQLLMKRHTKMDIEELPVPTYRHTIIPVSYIECNSYNTVVAGVQSNILLTSMEAKTSGRQDSLLHRRNARHAREALTNIRRSCVGGTRFVPTLSAKNWDETMSIAQATLDPEAVRRIRAYLNEAMAEGLSECACCSMKLSTLLVMSCCGSLICTECMDATSTQCLECEKEFSVDDFQRFQPGFELISRENIVDKAASRSPSALERPVELGGNINIIRQPVRRQRTRRFRDGHVCIFIDESGTYCPDGRCIFCRDEHNECDMLNEEKRCQVCGRRAEECPEEASKAYFLVNKFEELCKTTRLEETTHGEYRPLKVIVFSQFRETLNIVGTSLLKRFGAGRIAEYWGKYRKEELRKFKHHQDCFCLLLSKDGSEGLDLSLVTHIFFLEEIWDKSLEDQAVSRAWRMGAKGRVEVETLLAQNTVEERIREAKQSTRETGTAAEMLNSLPGSEQERIKTTHLLSSLRFITEYHNFAARQAEKTADSGRTKRKIPSPPTLLPETMDTEEPKKKLKFCL